MKLLEFKTNLQPLKFFSPQDILLIEPSFRLGTLYDWEKKGFVVKLRNNLYSFSDFQPQDSEYYHLANNLYQPSYVSTETALAHYSVIPEAVITVSSVTTRKTSSFSTQFGNFSYQTLKSDLFFGYVRLPSQSQPCMIATLEKAALDYLYLHPEIRDLSDFLSLRWNILSLAENLDQKKFLTYLSVFNQKRLTQRASSLLKWIKTVDA